MKRTFSFLILILSFFFIFSCKLLYNTDYTSSIVINFGSINQSRAAYTKSDLSSFIVSIEPKVQDDIKVDIAKNEMTARFTGLTVGTYKVRVSAFNADGRKIAYGESGNVNVKARVRNSVTIKMKFLGITDIDLNSNGFVKVKGTTINGTETWTPSSSVFKSGRQLTIPDLIVSDHEVTRGEFNEIMEADPSIAKSYDKNGNELSDNEALNNPVNYVNWYEAIAYCNKLSLAEGLTPCYSVEGITDWAALEFGAIPKTENNANWNAATCNFEANGYRLPTEAEWEWLARGGENYTYAGSNTVDDVAWSNSNTSGTRDVKSKNSNSYGLYDMSGNVWEWCWDWYVTPLKATYGETGPDSGDGRVHRGGTWSRGDSYCEINQRSSLNPFTRNSQCGFRVVRTDPDPIVNFNWYESPVDVETGAPATSSSTYVYFGVFPKTVVPESDLVGDNPLLIIDENITKEVGSNTYYKGNDGFWYAKAIENSDSASFNYSDGSTAKKFNATNPTTRYFKVEPIKWKVITTDYNGSGKTLLMAANALIGNIPFYESAAERTINGTTVYINNYKYSTIRAYLNGKYEAGDSQTDVYTNKGFLQTAFTSAAQDLIEDTEVDNSTETTGYDSDSYTTYICDNTTDKIFLLSMSEVINTDYGFDPYNIVSTPANHTTRQRVPTDFAQANNVFRLSTTSAVYWWVRSPFNSTKSVRAVTFNGANGNNEATTMNYGIVPALTIAF